MTSYLYYSVIIYHNYISALGRQYYGGKPNDSFCVNTQSLSHIPSHIYIFLFPSVKNTGVHYQV